MSEIHTCSYYCHKPECIKAQRNELREKMLTQVIDNNFKDDNTPPQRPWVGLTDEEIDVIYEQHHNQYGECESPNFGYERAIEAKLKDKNT